MVYAYDTWQEILDLKLTGLDVPLNDVDAFKKYSEFHWMFNKLNLCEIQGIKAAPHGVIPEEFPCFSKPICNLYGLSAYAYKMSIWEEHLYQPGHMWMEFLGGRHRSWDFLVHEGTAFWSHRMIPSYRNNSIMKWKTEELEVDKRLEKFLFDWIHDYFPDYSGCVNMETIGDMITECVPRMGTQFIDFFGDNYLDAVVSLYSKKKEVICPEKGNDGISRILRVPKHNARRRYYVRNKKELKRLEERVLSIELPWYEGRPLYDISDDPYTYRLAVINGTDEIEVEKVINEIKRHLIYEE